MIIGFVALSGRVACCFRLRNERSLLLLPMIVLICSPHHAAKLRFLRHRSGRCLVPSQRRVERANVTLLLSALPFKTSFLSRISLVLRVLQPCDEWFSRRHLLFSCARLWNPPAILHAAQLICVEWRLHRCLNCSLMFLGRSYNRGTVHRQVDELLGRFGTMLTVVVPSPKLVYLPCSRSVHCAFIGCHHSSLSYTSCPPMRKIHYV